jgi:hypothetical protein
MQAESPYKFLDYYEFNAKNPEPFFGRQSETQILLSDILVSRLVVLFAQTGTGKTSLINAGVRPLLEKRDYKHVLIRVRNDAAESAREELKQYLQVKKLQGTTLPKQLVWARNEVARPLVLFFDQFEEFFLQAPTQESRRRAHQFVSDIAALYEDSDNGVHIVFSMREEWFVKMDLFREHIPDLFQNESSLRLRFFQPPQAREAMAGPAELCGVEVEEALIRQVLKHLANEDDEIEPAQLQIICDSLWRNKADDSHITLDDYRRLGLKYAPTQKRPAGSIAQSVLTGRLVKAFEDLNNAAELDLLSRLLPQLSTEADTKSFRDLESLASGLGAPQDELKHLADYLESSGLIRTLDRGDLTFIELAHDYLAHRHRLKELQDRVKAIWPKKLLAEAIKVYDAYKADAKKGAMEITARGTEEVASLAPENLQTITENIVTSHYNESELDFLFRWALSCGSGLEVDTWFEEACKAGVDVWKTLEHVIGDLEFQEGAEKAVFLLSRVKEREKWPLLAIALKREDLTSKTIEVLGKMPEPESIHLLKTALSGKYRDQAIESLGRLRTMAALNTLSEFLARRESVEHTIAVLEKVSKRREDAIAVHARNIIERWKTVSESERSKPTHIQPEHYPSEISYERTLDDKEFDFLLERIVDERCLPILGPGINSATFPTGSQLSRILAKEFEYPLGDPSDLARVSQYLEVTHDSMLPREKILNAFRNLELQGNPNDPLGRMASLPFSLYITTNYDNLLQQQLLHKHKDAKVEYCRWKESLPEGGSFTRDFRPTRSQPLVYHIHGLSSVPESLVLTEEDYLTHLVNLSRDTTILPNVVHAALNRSSLLFLGFDIGSWEFSILFSLLMPALERSLSRRGHLCVQSLPDRKEYQHAASLKYFDRYFRSHNIRVYWGSVDKFTSALYERWVIRYESL